MRLVNKDRRRRLRDIHKPRRAPAPSKVHRVRPRKVHADLYGSANWEARRAGQLAAEPICQVCNKRAATDADHIERHNGNRVAFFTGPLQSICDPCHRAKSTLERSLPVKYPVPGERPLKVLRAGKKSINPGERPGVKYP